MTTTLTFNDYASGNSSSYPAGQVCLANDGNIWTTSGASNIWKITPAGVSTWVGTSFSGGIAQGSDGYIYVNTSSGGANYVYQIDLSTMAVTNYYYIGYGVFGGPSISGPDGNVWFIGDSGYPNHTPVIIRFDISTMTATGFSPTNGAMGQLYSDGTYLWSSGNDYLQRVDMSGTITSYYIASDGLGAIAPDGSGDLWLGGANLYKVTTSGSLLATVSLGVGASVRCGLLGPDGNPWFGDYSNQYLYQVDSAASTITTFAMRGTGTSPPNTGGTLKMPIWGAIGSDSNMWWSDGDAQMMVQVVISDLQMQIVMMP